MEAKHGRLRRKAFRALACFGILFVFLFLSALSALAENYINVCPTCEHQTLQSAVNAVPENNSELYVIRVAKGIYSGKTVISVSKRIKIEGGWDENFSQKSNDPSKTVLQHNQFGIVSVLANAGKDIEVTVENLRITGAFSSNYDVGGGISASAKYYYGGGIFIEAHSFGFVDATILNSIISNNEAMLGGGIAVNAWCEGYYPDVRPPAGDVKLKIINTTITKNTAKNLGIYGGGKGGGLKLLAGYGATKRNDGSIKEWIYRN